ncbi:hypothetical protein ANN_05820 [Periplaneta americana]|uniref:Uncharacterized protein n=1 Tax=Periplaneta americana TaxID=6978 RepID=A0ABQ8TDK5_PERAM|nr:hypothetical protein ANN_05820 [Periplaneta americana]
MRLSSYKKCFPVALIVSNGRNKTQLTLVLLPQRYMVSREILRRYATRRSETNTNRTEFDSSVIITGLNRGLLDVDSNSEYNFAVGGFISYHRFNVKEEITWTKFYCTEIVRGYVRLIYYHRSYDMIMFNGVANRFLIWQLGNERTKMANDTTYLDFIEPLLPKA